MSGLTDILHDFNGVRGCQKNHQEIQDLVEDKWVSKYGRENVYTNIDLKEGNDTVTEIDVLALTPYGPRVAEIKSCDGSTKARRQARKMRKYFDDPSLNVILVCPYGIKRI